MNYYEHWIGAWRKKTRRLSMTERGAYRELIDEIFAMDGEGLPPDPGKLYNIAGAATDVERAAVDEVVRRYFRPGPDGLLYQERAEEEVAKIARRMAASRENGKKSAGRPRKNPEKPTGLPVAPPAETWPVVLQPTGIPTYGGIPGGGESAAPPPPASAPPSPPPPPAVAAQPVPVHKPVKRPKKTKASRALSAMTTSLNGTAVPTTTPPAPSPGLVLPAWMLPEAWAAFVANREALLKKKGIRFTDEARKRFIERCEQAHSEGYDVNKLVFEAADAGWRTIYPPERRGMAYGDRRGVEPSGREPAFKAPPPLTDEEKAVAGKKLRELKQQVRGKGRAT